MAAALVTVYSAWSLEITMVIALRCLVLLYVLGWIGCIALSIDHLVTFLRTRNSHVNILDASPNKPTVLPPANEDNHENHVPSKNSTSKDTSAIVHSIIENPILVSNADDGVATAPALLPAAADNVPASLAIAADNYMSADEFLELYKDAHFVVRRPASMNKSELGRFPDHVPHYGLGKCNQSPNRDTIARTLIAHGVAEPRPLFFPLLGPESNKRTSIPHFVGMDGMVWTLSPSGNAWRTTGLPGGYAIRH